jgi:hypothetical protein
LVRRGEPVERGIPRLAPIAAVIEHIVAALSRHAQRLRPRIELSVPDRRDDAGDGKVIIRARGVVLRIARKFPRCGIRRSEVAAEGGHWIARLLFEGFGNPLLDLHQSVRGRANGGETRPLFGNGRVLRAAGKQKNKQEGGFPLGKEVRGSRRGTGRFLVIGRTVWFLR